jgi:hypothetical protein
MTVRLIGLIAAAALIAGCSSTRSEVQPGPDAPAVAGYDAVSVPAHGSADGLEYAGTAGDHGIPADHLPSAGQCRVWIPEQPAERQPQTDAGDCLELQKEVPPGGWLVYVLNGNEKQVVIREYGTYSTHVVAVRIFDVSTGDLVWEEAPGDR